MTEECVLSMWRTAEGEPVAVGDVLFEIETDKSTMEVESFHDGVLLKQVVAAGDSVPVNAICAWVGTPGEAIPEAADMPSDVGDDAPLPEPAPAGARPQPVPASVVSAARRRSDAATRGPGVSPRARARAFAAGVDVRSIAGSGPGGRIVERDVLAVVAARDAAAGTSAVRTRGPEASPPTPDGLTDDEEAPRPLSRMRRLIAERLTASTTVPTFTATIAADVSRILAIRDELRAVGSPVTVTDLVLAATAQTLAEFPDVNSRTDGQSVWPRRRVHLGVAVAVPAGLVVPVVRDADRLGLEEIHHEAARLAAEARAGRLPPEAMTGSTFTVSNLGMHGIEAFAAIINPGESGILAVGAAIPTPVAVPEGIAVRTLMRLTLTADHRLIDGELGARFLAALRRRLEDPTWLRLDLQSR